MSRSQSCVVLRIATVGRKLRRMKRIKYVVALFACGIAASAIFVVVMKQVDPKDDLQTKEIHFSYARYPEPRPGPAPDGATAVDLYFSRHPEYRHELSERFVREIFDALKKDTAVQKVFSALVPRFCKSARDGAKSALLEDIRGVEFRIDQQPKDVNPVRGTMIVHSLSEERADAIAGEYAGLLRSIVEDENRLLVAKATMSYYSDFHRKKKEIEIIGKNLSRIGIGDSDRQAALKDIERLEEEMKKIETEWQERSETYRKTMGGVLVFLDGGTE